MDTVFNAALLARPERAQGWRAALNSTYVRLDSTPRCREDYAGFLRATQFGEVLITDTLLSAQVISRRRGHIGGLDKDCFYFQFLQSGRTQVDTLGRALVASPVTGTLFSASEVYDLHCGPEVRSWWLEIGRDALLTRGASEADLDPGLFSLGHGLGRLAYEHMLSLAHEAPQIAEARRAQLGSGLIDLLVMALQEPDRAPGADDPNSAAEIRLRTAQRVIRSHLDKPGLTLAEIAGLCGISVGYLHRLFRPTGVSASDWLREERLKRGYDLLCSPSHAGMSVTDIAFASGFSSSSHFSTSFRARFGLRPRDVRPGAA